MKKIGLVVTLVLSVSGCATTAKYQTPPPLIDDKTSHVISKSKLLEQTSNTLKHINDEGDILYFQAFGGGGAGVGLLLGPLGVAANIAAIDSKTKSDVEQLKGKIKFKPTELFERSIKSVDIDISEGGQRLTKLSPYIYITKTKNDKLLFSSALIVEQTSAEGEDWVGKYFYQLDFEESKENVSQGLDTIALASLELELEQGFKEIVEMYLNDRRGVLISEQELTFMSDVINPRIKFEMKGQLISNDSKRVNIRTFGALYSFPKNSITFKLRNKEL